MFKWLARIKNAIENSQMSSGISTIENSQILICTIGNVNEWAFYLEQDKEIYRAYSNITMYQALDLADFLEFMSDKTFDVAHIFCTFESNGNIAGKLGIELAAGLRKSNVTTVLFASDSTYESFGAVFPQKQRRDLDTMNVVFTIERKGEYFTNFFQALFDQMATGKPMLMVWAEIAPQHDGPWMEKLPGTICIASRGNFILLP